MDNRPIEADVIALADEVKQLRSQLDKIVGLLGQTARHGGDEAYRQAREAGERVWNEARSTADEVVQRIEAKPVQSAMAAFGVGLLIGLLFGGRR
ncbi:MAG: hypothetical protein JOZ55_06460 [Alphaproteobacteria bacterium]|nr:hypothetical protein [Alphaproteobacteria bacterium]